MSIQKGCLDLEYHTQRENNTATKYRLLRRSKEVLQSIKYYKGDSFSSLLDVGTADAKMLEILSMKLSINTVVGLDYSSDLLRTTNYQMLNLFQGDAVSLPFKNKSFDVLIATAIIEHVSDPSKIIDEIFRVLKIGGICIITTPDPFFEKIATKLGHLKAEQHNITFNISDLVNIIKFGGFNILKAEKFMISPVGFPFEDKLEFVLKKMGLNCLLLNQIVIGIKVAEENIHYGRNDEK